MTTTPAAQLKQAADKPEDFGHEPVPGPPDYRGRKDVCARCQTRTVIVHRASHFEEDGYARSLDLGPAPWPCTSAVVLGLAAREVSR